MRASPGLPGLPETKSLRGHELMEKMVEFGFGALWSGELYWTLRGMERDGMVASSAERWPTSRKDIFEIVHPEETSGFGALIPDVMRRSAASVSVKLRILDAFGRWRWTEAAVQTCEISRCARRNRTFRQLSIA